MMDNLQKLVDEFEGNKSMEKESQSQKLIRLAADVEVFHTEVKEAYATFKVKKHYETWPLRGRGFRLWLTSKYYKEYGKAPSSQGLADALNVLEATAIFDGIEQQVFTRIAEQGNTIYIDLCNKGWEVVKVDADGWEIISKSPIRFIRSKSQKELPRPKIGGSISELRQFLNYKDEEDWKLNVAWILSTLRSGIPYPVLIIQGEQGSAKSTTTKVLKAIVDPSELSLRNLPKEERDLSIAAKYTWVLAFDNLSGLTDTMSDALCKLSTGGGFATRKLHSDDDEAVFCFMRPVILNGIDDIAKRQDLLESSIVLVLPAIQEENRTDEKTFWISFQKAQPRILGALLDIISGAIKELPNTKLKTMPRMADFAQWATATEKVLGWNNGDFINSYNKNRHDAIDQGIYSDLVATALLVFMNGRARWEGTVAELLAELNRYIDEKTRTSKAWPSDKKLRARLIRIAPALRTKGIEFTDIGRKNNGVTIRLDRVVN